MDFGQPSSLLQGGGWDDAQGGRGGPELASREPFETRPYVIRSHRKNLLSKISPTPPRSIDDNEISQPPFDARFFFHDLTNSHHRTVKMSLPNVSADLVWEITRTCHRACLAERNARAGTPLRARPLTLCHRQQQLLPGQAQHRRWCSVLPRPSQPGEQELPQGTNGPSGFQRPEGTEATRWRRGANGLDHSTPDTSTRRPSVSLPRVTRASTSSPRPSLPPSPQRTPTSARSAPTTASMSTKPEDLLPNLALGSPHLTELSPYTGPTGTLPLPPPSPDTAPISEKPLSPVPPPSANPSDL